MIREVIETRITKQDVLKRAQSLPQRARQIITSLYSENSGLFTCNASDIRARIEENKEKKKVGEGTEGFPVLNPLKAAAGVYVFIDADNVPVYVGKGGTGKKDDLARRVRNECKVWPNEDSGATLAKNIKQEADLLCQTVTDDQVVQIINSLRIVAINTGDLSDADNQQFASDMESILILLFKPRYNRMG